MEPCPRRFTRTLPSVNHQTAAILSKSFPCCQTLLPSKFRLRLCLKFATPPVALVGLILRRAARLDFSCNLFCIRILLPFRRSDRHDLRLQTQELGRGNLLPIQYCLSSLAQTSRRASWSAGRALDALKREFCVCEADAACAERRSLSQDTAAASCC